MNAPSNPRVLITGATGTIGKRLVNALRDRRAQVVALSRRPHEAELTLGDGVEVHEWANPAAEEPPAEALIGCDAVVNLLGEPLSQRWSASVKGAIRSSRVDATLNLVHALRNLAPQARPKVLLSQSATGYYGAHNAETIDESAPAGHDFLSDIVRDWERAATSAEDLCRVVVTRTGIVLANHGGAVEKMLPFFRIGIGGPVGGGKQYVPWVHVDDVVGAILYAIDHSDISGVVNVSAPEPVTNADFSAALGRTLHRPAFMPVPGIALRVLYGEMAEIVLTGARVIPRRLSERGFRFRHPALDEALSDVLR